MRLWVCVLALCAVLGAARVAHADPEPIFPIDVAVTSDENGAVVDRPWIDRQVALAEHVFGALAVHLRVERVRGIGTELARIEDPRMRDRFAPLVTPHQIQIFVVRSLRDDAEVGLYRRGVTWDSRTAPSRRYVILSADAAASSLAHELGHFFGIQPHSSVKNNLMSYDRDDALVFLDAAQQAIVKSTANTLRMSSALAVVGWN